MGILSEIKADVVKLVQADDHFARIPMIAENQGDIQTLVKTAIAKLGIVAIVFSSTAKVRGTNAPGPQFDPINCHVDVTELVLTNRTERGSGIPASDAAEAIAWLLHYPNHAGTRSDRYPLTCSEIVMVPDKTFLVYRVSFTTAGSAVGHI